MKYQTIGGFRNQSFSEQKAHFESLKGLESLSIWEKALSEAVAENDPSKIKAFPMLASFFEKITAEISAPATTEETLVKGGFPKTKAKLFANVNFEDLIAMNNESILAIDGVDEKVLKSLEKFKASNNYVG